MIRHLEKGGHQLNEDFEDNPGLLDDDPALDYILYKEMVKEDKQPPRQGKGGCLSLMLMMLVPPAGMYLLLDVVR